MTVPGAPIVAGSMRTVSSPAFTPLGFTGRAAAMPSASARPMSYMCAG